ncbi:MAG: DNA-directed RNA polymerase subunit H [Candidatus Thorarchaeota archaeon]
MVELPEMIVKTRALLNLRSYKVEELLEYENRYMMLPVKEVGEDRVKSVVWIYKEPKVVGVALVRDLVREVEEQNAQEGMLVGGSRFTPAAKKHARAMRIELVEGGYASFELFGHILVPKHIIATDDEVQLVLGHYGIEKPQFPRIRRDDPAARVLGAKIGQIVRIERESQTAGKTYYYRLVVDSAR